MPVERTTRELMMLFEGARCGFKSKSCSLNNFELICTFLSVSLLGAICRAEVDACVYSTSYLGICFVLYPLGGSAYWVDHIDRWEIQAKFFEKYNERSVWTSPSMLHNAKFTVWFHENFINIFTRIRSKTISDRLIDRSSVKKLTEYWT